MLGRHVSAPGSAGGSPSRRVAPHLTARESQVLALMLEGKSNKRISRQLGMAEATVKNHVTAILKALGASNRTEAVIAAGRLGWKPGSSVGH